MSDRTNSFEEAAQALAQVRGLVVSGEQLKRELNLIVKEAEAASTRVEKALKSETTEMGKSTKQILDQYKALINEIESGVKRASDQLKATATKIEATAIQAVKDLQEKATTTVESVEAQVVIAQDRFERAAVGVEAASKQASERIVDAGQRVDRVTDSHREELSRVASRLSESLLAFERGERAIKDAQREIAAAREQTTLAHGETLRAKEEIMALRISFEKQVRKLLIAVGLLFMIAMSALAWGVFR